MKQFKLRVDLTDDIHIDRILDKVQSMSDVYAYVVEGSGTDNKHSHWYIELSNSSERLRQHLRSLGLKGNASYSLKELDERYPVEYIAYLMKEGKPQFKNIPLDVIDGAIAYNAKVKSEIKSKKERKRTQLQCLIDYIDENFPDKTRLGPQEYIRIVVLYYKDNGLLYREFQVLSLAQSLFLRYSPDGVKLLCNRLYDKMV